MVRTKSWDDVIDGVRLESSERTCKETESLTIFMKMQLTHLDNFDNCKVESLVSLGIHEIRCLQEWEKGLEVSPL